MLGTMEKSKNTLTSIYLSSLKKDVFQMRARHFSSCCVASLYGNAIDVDVYDNLIETVHEHLPLLHRYVELRKKCSEKMSFTYMTYTCLWSRTWMRRSLRKGQGNRHHIPAASGFGLHRPAEKRFQRRLD